MTKTKDDYLVDCILCNQRLAEVKKELALAQDGIRIALNIAGYDIESMNQFERASAILDIAQECAALTDVRKQAQTWERLYTKTWEQTMEG